MSLNTYDVFLVDCTGGVEEAARKVVGDTLRTWFTQALSLIKTGATPSLSVQWGTIASDPAAVDLVVYLVRDIGSNALRYMPGYTAPSAEEAVKLSGLTSWSTRTTWRTSGGKKVPGSERSVTMYASEIYTSKAKDGADMAMMAFHEAMHNQLGHEFDLHANGGGGVADEVVRSGTVPNEKNLSLMAESIAKRRQNQWLEGYSKVNQTGLFRPQFCQPDFAYA